MPLVRSMKNLIGLIRVKYCKNFGISSIGDINPERSMAGIWNVITPKIACCWVLQIDDIKSPTPTIDNNEIKIETKNSRNDPIKGILNAVITITVIMQVRHIAITSGGIVFPSRISKEVSGLTISWSKVPISLSLAIERAVSSKVITRASIATITV